MKHRPILKFNRVPVHANLGFFLAWSALWAGLTWLAGIRKPERNFSQRLGIGLILSLIPMSADIGHALAHTISAQAAHAPMDEIRLGLDMPRTIYFDENVSPVQHIQRALGGPIFNFSGFGLSLLWRQTTTKGSIYREMADLAGLSHGALVIGSLAPLPIVDGGTLLKWWWVNHGLEINEAENRIRRISMGLGAGLLAGGTILFALGHRLWGLMMTGLGGVCTAAGSSWIH